MMDSSVLLSTAFSIIGALMALLVAYQKKTNAKVDTISSQMPVLLQQQLVLKEALRDAQSDLKAIRLEINHIEKSVLELRERNHASNNEMQKLLISNSKDSTQNTKNIEDKLSELKDTLKDYSEKIRGIEHEMVVVKQQIVGFGKVKVK